MITSHYSGVYSGTIFFWQGENQHNHIDSEMASGLLHPLEFYNFITLQRSINQMTLAEDRSFHILHPKHSFFCNAIDRESLYTCWFYFHVKMFC